LNATIEKVALAAPLREGTTLRTAMAYKTGSILLFNHYLLSVKATAAIGVMGCSSKAAKVSTNYRRVLGVLI
jgi:hypothetical protein